MTQIEWTHLPGFKGESWNPIVGCSIVSKGCTNCYAMKQAGRILRMTDGDSHYAGTVRDSKAGPVWTGKVATATERAFTAPLRARKPRCYFVNSMGDLFAEGVPDEWIDQVFAVMALCPEHRFIVLTKRPERMRDYLRTSPNCRRRWENLIRSCAFGDRYIYFSPPPVLPNVWLGTSVEDQVSADARIPLLLETPAAIRFISAEPLLGPVDLPRVDFHCDLCGGTGMLARWPKGKCHHCGGRGDIPAISTDPKFGTPATPMRSIDWVITGGESGPDARPMHPDWARSLRDQCAAAGVPFFFKQWGRYQPVYDRDVDDPDWRQCGSIEDTTPKGRWLNLEGGHGFHGDRVVRVDPVGKRAAGHLLDGVEHFNWPDDPAGGSS